MRLRLVPWVALVGLGLALTPQARVEEPAPKAKSAKPTLVVRVKGLDGLFADARFLAALVGLEEQGKQFEGVLKAKTGPKGLEGIDTKKPFGLYATIKPKLEQSEYMLLLPIADEKAFLALLENLDSKPEKSADGVYTVEVENVPVPIMFRFAHGYAYATAKAPGRTTADLAKATLPLPGAILEGGAGELLTVTLNLDQVPPSLRGLVLGKIEEKVDELKDMAPPDETEGGKAFRLALLDNAKQQLSTLVTDGKALTLRLDVDRKANDLSLALGMSAKAGTGLARDIAALELAKSVGASLIGKTSAANGYLNLSVPAGLRQVLAGAIEEGFKKDNDKETDKAKRDMAATFFNALRPTLKAGAIDAGLDLRSPGKGEKYTLVVGLRLTEGKALEKTVKDLVAKLPAEVRDKIAFDFDKVGDINIHRITQDKIDAKTKATLGDGPVFVAIRSDALLVGLGEHALSALKEAIPKAPRPASPLRAQASVARLAKLLEADFKNAPELARETLATPGSDAVRLSIQGGRSLELRFAVKGQVIGFLAKAIKAKQAENNGER